MRGYSAIGLVRPKHLSNIGSVLRAAYCYGSSLVVVQGSRTKIKQSTDTAKAWRHMPIIRTENLREHIPYEAIPIAVDIIDDAAPLPSFRHPERAFYIFGPEDGTLSDDVTEWCKYRIVVPTRFCMNLAATVNVVLYDRMTKQ